MVNRLWGWVSCGDMAVAARPLSSQSIQPRDLNLSWGNLELGNMVSLPDTNKDPKISTRLGPKAS